MPHLYPMKRLFVTGYDIPIGIVSISLSDAIPSS